MHVISSYRGNRPIHPPTHPPTDRTDYNTLRRSQRVVQKDVHHAVEDRNSDWTCFYSASNHRRLATALAHAYNVIEMCASAAPPIRLPIPNPNPKPYP